MNRFPILVFIIAVLVADLVLFQRIILAGLRPDATAIIIAYVALRFGCFLGMIMGFLIGLANFALMTTACASMPLAATVVGYMVGKFGTKVAYESPLVQVGIIFFSVLVLDMINLLWMDPKHLVFNLARFSLGSGLYTGLVGVGLAEIVSRLSGFGRVV